MSTFIFYERFEARTIVRAEVPVGIQSKVALLNALFSELALPNYFGGNWDALDECICDLSCLPLGDVILRHRDVPLTDNREALTAYLSILQNAITNCNTTCSNTIYISGEQRPTASDL